jgi:hypothetical protein
MERAFLSSATTPVASAGSGPASASFRARRAVNLWQSPNHLHWNAIHMTISVEGDAIIPEGVMVDN